MSNYNVSVNNSPISVIFGLFSHLKSTCSNFAVPPCISIHGYKQPLAFETGEMVEACVEEAVAEFLCLLDACWLPLFRFDVGWLSMV